MSETFGASYAIVYDSLYADKNYLYEAKVLADMLGSLGVNRGCSILDLGCGTGNYAFPLAEHGFEVLGVDRSTHMLEQARRKASGGISTIDFTEGDLRNVDLSRTFDAVIMMFAVLGYQVANSDVVAALNTVRHHLRPGGLFLFDVWYGPAVLSQRPSQRIKTVRAHNTQTIRSACGSLDVFRNLCTVDIHVWHLDGSTLITEVTEHHPMRYFFIPELLLFLEAASLSLVAVKGFPQIHSEPSEDTWTLIVAARAV